MSILPSSTAPGPAARRLLAVTARAWGLRPTVRAPGAAVPHPHLAQRTARHVLPAVPLPASGPCFAISY
ncbi:hypothetical protein QRO11_12715 [Paracidovorax citrulli]|uniref:Uncharacterized protein n=1 Tax=Paracidovorax citrulli TaxID=80869 RepID=A0ABY9AIR4_PARCI|nr:hypothetical protein [Paracidovorax citrulli]ATG94218.1 hypothetical protein CQB05_09380 [Paracidovorax citrulli]PVY63040.1 hypothetical protein C8E08_0310 [Paracidovorax citrulli]QCX12660.1 hypothetical protein APS58_3950 [Paracidovorax citrulli]REG67977.1 hypothetical protein C8E07_1069 [Paracidovorax citrulli]RLJ92536.1 hypothetical protein C8E06_1070 [Paracidovorax citrulli]